MKEFLVNNWYYVLAAALLVAGFVASLIINAKKKGANIFDTVKMSILENLPYWIMLSESLAGGENKKANVLSLGIALASKMLGHNLSAEENDYFVAFISEQLEKVLTTPQKKLDAPKKADLGKYRAK